MTTLRASAEHNALRHPKFVLYLIAIGCASFAVQIMSVSVGWEIYDITRDPLYLGYVGLVQFLPPLLLVLVTGLAADRFNRRLIMASCLALEAVCALGLLLFTLSKPTDVTPVFGILAVLVSHSMGRWGRAMVYAICAVLVVAIAYSRVYLGAHWFSDVLAGLLFGVVMMAAFGVAIEAIPPRRIKPLGLFAMALLVFLVAGSVHVATGFGRASEVYAMPERQILVPVSQWVNKDWELLPPRRIDFAGRPEENFIAQFAGNPDQLATQLEAGGWTVSPVWTWKKSLPYLNPNASLQELPPRPALHEGLKARLTLIREAPGGAVAREVIRVYKTGLAAAEGTTYKPIYLVSLTREVRSRGFELYAIPSQRPASEADVEALRDVLARAQGISMLSQHDRGGTRQDLITALP